MAKEKLKLAQGYREAKKITQQKGKGFYFSSFFLPRKKKRQAYSIYAVCRLSDDAVDCQSSNSQKEKYLLEIKNRVSLAYAGQMPESALMQAFSKTVKSLAIPSQYFFQLIEGMEMDLEKSTYASFEELYQYAYKAAGVVGLIMLFLFEFKDDAAKEPAIALGVAMQLTNILRDIKEDFFQNRTYLPQDELRKFQVNISDLNRNPLGKNFIEFMKFQTKRAQDYYKKAELGIKLIPGRRCRLTILLMKNIYAAILTEIKKNNYDVWNKRLDTSFFTKVVISLKTIFKFNYL